MLNVHKVLISFPDGAMFLANIDSTLPDVVSEELGVYTPVLILGSKFETLKKDKNFLTTIVIIDANNIATVFFRSNEIELWDKYKEQGKKFKLEDYLSDLIVK